MYDCGLSDASRRLRTLIPGAWLLLLLRVPCQTVPQCDWALDIYLITQSVATFAISGAKKEVLDYIILYKTQAEKNIIENFAFSSFINNLEIINLFCVFHVFDFAIFIRYQYAATIKLKKR